MPTTIEEVAKVIAAKAKKIGLTSTQLHCVLELSEDVEQAGVEAFSFVRNTIGSVLTLISTNARYIVWVIKSEREIIKTAGNLNCQNRLPKDGEAVLRCYLDNFDTVSNRLFWESEANVKGFEGLREAILWHEGYAIEINDGAEKKELVKL